MNPYARYQLQASSTEPRIDMLLSLFDAACDRTEAALDAMAGADQETARRLRVRARLVVLGLWSGVDNDRREKGVNLVGLYQFVTKSLAEGSLEEVRGSLEVLRTLREGFRGIREEAIQLERDGVIPPIDAICAIHAVG